VSTSNVLNSFILFRRTMIKRIAAFTSLTFLLLAICGSCQTSKDVSQTYPRMIGDISHDTALDDPSFELCNDESKAVQYYALNSIFGDKPFVQEKYEVERIFEENYDSSVAAKESGLIRIRFLVNCEGQAGRFRVLGMDEAYNEKEFDTTITDQLLTISKKSLAFKPCKTDKGQADYYMYIIFKIKDGAIVEILP